MTDIRITDEAILPQTCTELAHSEAAGGMALFIGSVRNETKGKKVLYLEFEAYESMALREMEKIAKSIEEKWKAHRIVIHHRTGHLKIGDIAVMIAVSTPHRKAAFAACQYAIDTLKETVPIWKKEYFEDGAVWVSAHP